MCYDVTRDLTKNYTGNINFCGLYNNQIYDHQDVKHVFKF